MRLLMRAYRAYDYSRSSSSVAGHIANWNPSSSNPGSTPLNTHQAIIDYVKAGVHANKIVVGMPLYGRSFANTGGPGARFAGVGKGTWEPGVYDYKDLPQAGATMYSDNATVAAWSFDSAQQFMVSFETPAVVGMKATFIVAQGLGGAMWWESSGDKKGTDSLISTVGLHIKFC
jgi:chitinase